MAIETDLSVSPYHDDFKANSEYYKILFKPGVSVQTREINQLQSILQNQIEKFGDNILQKGTILEGCNFQFNTPYPYVKILDNEISGIPAAPTRYVNYLIKNQANLQAIVINSQDGFESTDPNLKTLYIHYRNAGTDGNTFAFSANDVLTVYDQLNGVFSVTVQNGGLNFSNSDVAVFLPSLAVNVSSGTFTNGEYITNPITGANVQIVGIDDMSLVTVGQVILTVQPRNLDLINVSSNASFWSMGIGNSIKNIANTTVATIENVYGFGANATIVTDGSGRITNVVMANNGSNYSLAPNVRIKSANNSTGLAALSLVAQNYIAKVTASSTAGAVGNGYNFSITEGTIYQKGFFMKVPAQQVIVSKYDQSPNNISVGFITREAIIDANEDTTLLDNATGTENEFAPGADRLQLTPELAAVITTGINPNTNFLPIVQFSEGVPFRLQSTSVYSQINAEMARRTADLDGDTSVDLFQVTTRSPINAAFEGNTFSIIIDPGTAYIDGYRVQTVRNFSLDTSKGITINKGNTVSVPLAYRNYIRVKEIGGVFQFSTGDLISFYDAPKAFISNVALSASGNTAPQGNAIGTARVRSMIFESGTPGSSNCVYRLYLFSVNMNTGKNFSNIRSVYYNGTYKGIADIALELDPTTAANVAQIHFPSYDQLLFSAGVTTLQNASNTTYQYRTIDQTLAMSNTGQVIKSLAGTPNEFFPYSGTLGPAALEDLYLIPLANLQASANMAGTGSVNTTANALIGTGTNFITDLAPGDYVYLYANSTTHDVRMVTGVANNTQVSLDAVSTIANTTCAIYRFFPGLVPIPLATRNGFAATVGANGNVLTINLNINMVGPTTTNVALGVNIQRTNIPAGTKSAARGNFVKIDMANNAEGHTGPWCLGVPDIIRLGAVYISSNSTINTNCLDVTKDFYIDHNQNQNYLDLGWLMLQPGTGLTVNANTWLLVQFDSLTVSNSGYYNTTSYISSNVAQMTATDSLPLANLSSSINTWEIPEVYDAKGNYYDLMNQFDFRPIAIATANLTTNAASATINPSNAVSFGNTANSANDRKFPLPDSSLTTQITEFQGRTDSVFVGKDGNIFTIKGVPSGTTNNLRKVNQPSGSMKLNDIFIPPYPDLPIVASNTLAAILNTRIANENYSTKRQQNHKIVTVLSLSDQRNDQPQAYTNRDIGTLDRRISQLEYYQSLSLLETDVNSRVIPSSVDPGQNRFKFGFYADDFSTGTSQDIQNPQYNAALVQTELVPNSYHWTVTTSSNGVYTSNYIDWPVANQPYATTNVIPCVCEVVVTYVNVVEWFFHRWICRSFWECGWRFRDDDDDYYETYDIEYGPGGHCGLFFYTDWGYARFRVYEGGTLICTSGAAIDIDHSGDIDKVALIDSHFEGLGYGTRLIGFNGDFVTGHGKIVLPLCVGPSRRFTVLISKGRGCRDVRFCKIGYPISSLVCVCPTPPQQIVIIEPPRCCNYIGIWAFRCFFARGCFCLPWWELLLIGLALIIIGVICFLGRLFRCYNRHKVHIRICGMRPLCRHRFFVCGEDATSRCATARGIFEDEACLTNEFGIAEFWYYHFEGFDDDRRLECYLRAPNSEGCGFIELGSGQFDNY